MPDSTDTRTAETADDRFAEDTPAGAGWGSSAIRSVGVVGAGMMGRGIALATALRGIPVTLSDASGATLERSIAALRNELSRRGAENDKAAAGAGVGRLIRPSRHLDDFAGVDLVVEAAIESLAVKKQIFKRLDSLARPAMVLASNTSCIPIGLLADALHEPQRLCGLHFCHPVGERRLVEVVRAEKTGAETIAAAVWFAREIGKLPIVVSDGPGFVVNRLLLPYLNEAVELLLEGTALDQVEGAAVEFGMPWGPITQLDSIGIDVAVRAGAMMYKAFPHRVVASELLVDLYRAGRLGEKTGAGFFAHPQADGPRRLDLPVQAIIHRRGREKRPCVPDEVILRLFLPMLIEATRLIEERVVADVRDIDRAMVHGLGFAADKGGILVWAEQTGVGRIVEWLRQLEPLGERYRPTQTLLTMAEHKCVFDDSRLPRGSTDAGAPRAA